jgi:nitrile hydratase
VLATGAPTERKAATPARFRPGDRVRAKNIHPVTHTRLPRYLRGHTGEIVHVHGVHVFPDSNAHGKGEDPQWLYAVRFSARELWGEDRSARDTVTADCWEPYLETA